MKSLAVGELHPDYPGDPFHHVLAQILLVARAGEIQAIDGPYLQVRDQRPRGERPAWLAARIQSTGPTWMSDRCQNLDARTGVAVRCW